MAEYTINKRPNREPTHPGAVLRDTVIPAVQVSVSEFARQIGVSRQTLHRILAETHGITPEMALRIGKYVGNGPGIWLRMQQAYDLWHTEKALSDELEKIQTHAA